MYGVSQIKAQLQNRPLSNNTDDEVLNFIKVALLKAFADVGHVPSEQDFQYVQSSLFEVIKGKYYWLRPNEIIMAFRNGVARKYGEYYGYNFVTFQGFIEKYIQSDERKQASKEFMSEMENKLALPEKKLEPKEFAEWVKEQYYLKGEVLDMTGTAYYYYESTGDINLTLEQKKGYMAKAKEILTSEYKKHSTTLEGLRDMNKFLENLENKNKTTIEKVAHKARKLVLKDYFDKIKDEAKK